MSDWHVSFGMGENDGGLLGWGFDFIKEIIEKIVEVIRKATGRKVYYCPNCNVHGTIGRQFYSTQKPFSSTVEIKCGQCYAVIGTLERNTPNFP